ncbi:Site-specific DNA recombinase [Tranquillimonas rosea]|uniref:Site-specific DNA recombinase n=1 Tax=Tranquillimonas rosea TaxID=641238 RepID=A0A1H9S9F5_9RHOB|nr:recombinase family protein [Tranquillimonas rosea]SER81548.1 Site-specific DNA recombinase [Tranquillimonas rosea]
MKQAYSYLRMSTDVQLTGDSLRRQLEASRVYAEQNGYQLVDNYKDIGVSAFKGDNAQSGALSKFLADVKSGRIPQESILIIESLDRLTRSKITDALELFFSIINSGIGIVTLFDNQYYTKESIDDNTGQIHISIIAMMRANEESETKSKRLQAVWKKKRDEISEIPITSKAPSWLRLTDDRRSFEIIEHRAKTVQKIFDLYIGGLGVYAITKHLNSDLENHPPIAKAKHWNKSYVNKILKNEATVGTFQPHKKNDGKRTPEGGPVEDYFPQIISIEKFTRAQLLMKERRTTGAGRKGTEFSNLFSRLAYCGNCGGTMIFRNKGRPPKGQSYLLCQNSYQGNGCTCPHWRYDEFENSFLRLISEIDLNELESESNENAAHKSSLKERRAVLQAKIDEAESKISNLSENLGLLTNPTAAKTVAQKIDATQSMIDEAETSIKQINSELFRLDHTRPSKATNSTLKHYEDRLTGTTPEEAKIFRAEVHALLRDLIERIEVFNGFEVHPSDVPDLVPNRLLYQLAQEGYTESKQLEQLFESDYGKRRLDEFERNYVVKFRNGTHRLVWPGLGGTMQTINEFTLKAKEKHGYA